ncbi:Glutaredoxin [Penicillium waksmanii]|uniref:Glutaredoxin n=1 Tax=Penicillium waksmanii TaxID=69791 RepID=UPI00254807DD|nr:Glutaredoxin [Penicillium waksmanii]KAJ5999695.1 Glutaredoxin [Penicillium waksmanii]
MSDSTLYLYTSLTAGSSHIVTATARVETILKANKLPFQAIDVATDEAARKLWGRRSKGKKLPGLVKYGDIVGDLEEIEEWNEFGELRMVVNSVQDMGGMPATSNPAPAPETKTEPEPKTPKPSTIKIQSPPAKEEKKDEMVVLALRQASQEAASQAKTKADEKKIPNTEEPTSTSPTVKAHRGSVAPELPDTAPDSPKSVKRPTMVVPEDAAMSSANFHVANAEMLGLVQHHRGSIISANDEREQDKVVKEIRQSISGDHRPGDVEALRKEAALKQFSEDPVVEVEEKEGVEDEKSTEVEGGESKETGEVEKNAEKAEEKEKAQDEEKEDDKKDDLKEDKKEDKDAAEEESKTEAVSASKE